MQPNPNNPVILLVNTLEMYMLKYPQHLMVHTICFTGSDQYNRYKNLIIYVIKEHEDYIYYNPKLEKL